MSSSKGGHAGHVPELLRCKWTAWIVCCLADGVRRPAQIRRATPGLSMKVLYERLHELQKEGFVTATVFEGYPRRTEYSLTESGWQLVQMLRGYERREIPLSVLSEVLKCRWLRDIVGLLHEGAHRPSQLRKQLLGISNKVLVEKLEKLERLGVVIREVSSERPVAVWYRLSALGMRLAEVLRREEPIAHEARSFSSACAS